MEFFSYGSNGEVAIMDWRHHEPHVGCPPLAANDRACRPHSIEKPRQSSTWAVRIGVLSHPNDGAYEICFCTSFNSIGQIVGAAQQAAIETEAFPNPHKNYSSILHLPVVLAYEISRLNRELHEAKAQVQALSARPNVTERSVAPSSAVTAAVDNPAPAVDHNTLADAIACAIAKKHTKKTVMLNERNSFVNLGDTSDWSNGIHTEADVDRLMGCLSPGTVIHTPRYNGRRWTICERP